MDLNCKGCRQTSIETEVTTSTSVKYNPQFSHNNCFMIFAQGYPFL